MSVITKISTLPDTRQGFELNQNTLALIKGIFITEKTFTFPSIDAAKDIESFYTAMGINDIIPLHYVSEYESLDQEIQVNESKQNFTYASGNKGNYRHKLKYDWKVDYHQAVEALTGTDYNVIYWDINDNIYLTSDDGVTLRGFTTNRLILEKIIFQAGNVPAFSTLDIELYDSSELNERGVVISVDWDPSDVDRLFINLKLDLVTPTDLSFTARYNDDIVTDISSQDVTLEDDINGTINFTLFNSQGGVYRLSGFLDNGVLVDITSGTLTVVSTKYLGCIRYVATIVVTIESSFLLLDDDDFALLDDDAFALFSSIIETPFQNGGYLPTTDWINPIDGVAQYWSSGSVVIGVATGNIITGSGFTGNAQEIVYSNIGTTGGINLKSVQLLDLIVGKTYTIKFMYMASNPVEVFLIKLGSFNSVIIPANIVSASLASVDIVAPHINSELLLTMSAAVGEFLRIDQVRIEEII